MSTNLNKFIIYSKDNCKYCDMSKNLLFARGLEYTEKRLNRDYDIKELEVLVPNVRSVPQIFFNSEHIGGYEDLVNYVNY